ncbi:MULTISPECIES: ArsJ-associated glyceraldehyde-3-phosphate dehydrogenase [Thiorhodovibrio]|uniref:ArsJ-associated glyceraldehyde-3-phosphate dehydrogenase n=1 Tax=Thiorhodovibrio TaxID=61593 RepID=UPI001912D293|nr:MULTISPECIES: ArsJ-associated glyceraldehyde-3-phosphate dehydrogenase [Thiorhodovibrio]MBK5968922.1 type I glyceraldehyde-3-phosphate dehydrogenase [Thiorhodovibrio winogradskyi]WPL10363.1 Glyceraldehyde-3-phosphate dehydrogenase 3 [Thiorhodovibrio litoralis]
MTVSIGINGFGRMGRLALRAAWGRLSEGERAQGITRINEIACDAAGSAHLLEFDSVHGRWPYPCAGEDDRLTIDDQSLHYSSAKTIAEGDWSNCDIVIEATGKHHKQPELLDGYFAQGVKKVLVAAPTKGALDIVYGVNHDRYDPERHPLVTAASCTTNCLAPVVKVMHEQVGIRHGSMTTLHNITNTQRIVDLGHKDLRRARACGQSLIPTTTGSARAITKIFPELTGKLNGHAVRVPLLNASLTDFVFEAERSVTAEEINALLKTAAEGELAGILGYEERPLVSVDYLNDPRSSIVDALSTLVVNDTQVKIYAWYDNEWGYANRMVDIAHLIARAL